MSVEVPKETGTIAPVTPPKPAGRFSGFLKRLFGVPPEYQSTQQLTPRVVQPSPGLEDFASRINKVSDETSEWFKQHELARIERERQEAESMARRVEVEAQQKQQIIESRLQKLDEVKGIAERLNIRERLKYINTTVWEGKGQVRDISKSPEADTAYDSYKYGRFSEDSQVGFECTYSYQSVQEEMGQGSRDWYEWRYSPVTRTASLRIFVRSIEDYYSGKEKGNVIDIYSPYAEGKDAAYIRHKGAWVDHGDGSYSYLALSGSSHEPLWSQDFFARIDLDSLSMEDATEKLDQILIYESSTRMKAGAIPSKLSKDSQEVLRHYQLKPQWLKWETASRGSGSGSY